MLKDYKTISDEIRSLLESLKKSQAAFCRIKGISYGNFNKLMNLKKGGENRRWPLDMLNQIVETFKSLGISFDIYSEPQKTTIGKEIAGSSTEEDTSSKSGGGESMVIKENGLVEIIKSKVEVIETQKKLLEAKDEIIVMQLKRLAQLELEKEEEKEGAVKESKK